MNPNPPRWLDKTGKSLWTVLAPVLAENGLLNDATHALAATVCEHYSVYRAAAKQLRREGRVVTGPTGAVKTHPLVLVEKQAWQSYVRGLVALGVTERQIEAPSEKEDELDDYR